MKPKNDAGRSERLGRLYTGAVADILDKLGPRFRNRPQYRNQCLSPDIRPLDPAMKVAGPVFTVCGRARHYDDGRDPRYRQMDMRDAIVPGSVVVMHPGDDTTASHWGELMSMTVRSKGATGTVITGGLPDSAQILELESLVFRKCHMPATAVYRYDITDFDVPVRIGGVVIAPGDFILGDIDGILVIPVATVDEFIEKAESVREPEDIVRKALHEGGNIRDLFEKYRVL